MYLSYYIILFLFFSNSAYCSVGNYGEMHFEKIKKISATVDSISDFLARLPNKYLEHYVFMFESNSLQEASYLDPRAIVFTADGQFVMTFNGSSKQEGFESIETMRFTSEGNNPRFIFEEIVFKNDLNNRVKFLKANALEELVGDLISREGRSGPNASVCLSCHREDPRPNWEHYPFWPGAYGQNDSKLFSTKGYQRDPLTNESVSIAEVNTKAAKMLPLFIERATTHKRYKYLVDIKNYAKISTRQIEYYESIGYDGDVDMTEERSEKRPLFLFTDLMSELNAQRIARMIRDSGDTDHAIKMAIVTSTCGPFDLIINWTKQYVSAERLFGDIALEWEDFFMNTYYSDYVSLDNSDGNSRYVRRALLEWFPETLQQYIHPAGFIKDCPDQYDEFLYGDN